METSITTQNKNITWRRTDDAIVEALYNIIETTGKIPSYRELSKTTGLSYDAVCRHMKAKNVNDFVSDYKSYMPAIIVSVGKKAIEGDVAAAKLFMQFTGFSEKTSLDATVKSDTTLAVRFVGVDEDVSETAEYNIVSEDDDEDGLPVIDSTSVIAEPEVIQQQDS